jgi:hypothetical protein
MGVFVTNLRIPCSRVQHSCEAMGNYHGSIATIDDVGKDNESPDP